MRLGYISRNITLDQVKYEDHTYTFSSESGQLTAVATGKKTNGYFIGTLTTNDKKTFRIPFKEFFGFDYNIAEDENVQMMLILLIQNGYSL